MHTIRLQNPVRPDNAEIRLPASKSISNRALIISALCHEPPRLKNLSDAEDTRVLQQALAAGNGHINIGHAGTAMRFFTAYAAATRFSGTVTGSERMKERPVHVLVDALRELNADITYLEKEGYPPLRINPSALTGKTLKIDSSISSQYISALMMTGPVLPGGLRLTLEKPTVSEPYIHMTAQLMNMFGAEVIISGNRIIISEKPYTSTELTIESDWSAAAFWYEWIALSEPGSSLLLENLKMTGLQGDEITAEIFQKLGVDSVVTNEGILIKKQTTHLPVKMDFDLVHCPDLAPALVATLAGLRVAATITGLQTLTIKESNRIEALKTELEKTGAVISTGNDFIQIHSFRHEGDKKITFSTYNDHRMAMAMAPLVTKFPEVEITDPEVVIKSYPGFWENVKKCCTAVFE